MGEAKRRGTFEERKAASIKYNAMLKQQRVVAIGSRPDFMSVDKERQRRVMNLLTMMTVITKCGKDDFHVLRTRDKKSYLS